MLARMSDFNTMLNTMKMFSRMDRMFSDFDRGFLYRPSFTVSNTPKTNVIENGDAFEVHAEVPGIKKEDIEIKIQGNYLSISGKREVDTPEGYKVHRSERGSKSFTRSFTLPEEVDSEKVEATLKDGILSLRLPKSEAAKPKQITIN